MVGRRLRRPSVAANLVFVIPLALMGLLLLPLYARNRRFWELVDSLAGPTIVIAFVLLAIPLSKSAGQFYFGVKTLSETTGSLVSESLRQPPVGSALMDALDARMGWMFLEEKMIPLLFWGASVAAFWLMLRVISRRILGNNIAVHCSGHARAFGGLLGNFQRSSWSGLSDDRTALYILPLTGFAVILGASLPRSRWFLIGLSSVASVLAIVYIAELRTAYFSEWRSEAGIKRLDAIHCVQMRAIMHNVRPVTAGGSWNLEYSVRYYGVRYRMPWLQSIECDGKGNDRAGLLSADIRGPETR